MSDDDITFDPIFRQGVAACDAGKTDNDCPYRPELSSSEKRIKWMRGYFSVFLSGDETAGCYHIKTSRLYR